MYFVCVCADAVCTRRDSDRTAVSEPIRDCGADIRTMESAVFEMLRQAGTEQFKACMPLIGKAGRLSRAGSAM